MRRNMHIFTPRKKISSAPRREMQTGGRCGGGCPAPGVRSDSAPRPQAPPLCRGGSGILPKALQHFEENALVMEADYPVPALGHAFHRSRKAHRCQGQLRAGLRLSARTAQATVPRSRGDTSSIAAAGESAPISLAGSTRELFKTRQSLPQQVGELIKCICSISPVVLFRCRSREWSRCSSGVCAISLRQRSKLEIRLSCYIRS